MKRYRVELAPAALAQAEAVEAWWRVNRADASGLFLDELTATIRTLETAPRIGGVYVGSSLPDVRRLYMPRTRHHLYYRVDEDAVLVRIHAVWHSARGSSPSIH